MQYRLYSQGDVFHYNLKLCVILQEVIKAMDITNCIGRPPRHGICLTLSEHTALIYIREVAHTCWDSLELSSVHALGRALAERQLLVTVRTSLPNGFYSLRHQYLLVQTHIGGRISRLRISFAS